MGAFSSAPPTRSPTGRLIQGPVGRPLRLRKGTGLKGNTADYRVLPGCAIRASGEASICCHNSGRRYGGWDESNDVKRLSTPRFFLWTPSLL